MFAIEVRESTQYLHAIPLYQTARIITQVKYMFKPTPPPVGAVCNRTPSAQLETAPTKRETGQRSWKQHLLSPR